MIGQDFRNKPIPPSK